MAVMATPTEPLCRRRNVMASTSETLVWQQNYDEMPQPDKGRIVGFLC